MIFEDLLRIYEREKKKYGDKTFQRISEILAGAKKLHKKDFIGKDHEQSWRAFKGKNLEKLIEHILIDEIQSLGLSVVNGNSLERTLEKNLPDELSKVKRNLFIDFGEFGAHLPDVDIIIYRKESSEIIALLSIKVTLRERIAQTGYWKLKLLQANATKHIKVFFITPDEDDTLLQKNPSKKGRAIVEVDTDGGYVLSKSKLEESKKVKMFDKLIIDLKKLFDNNK